MLRGVPRIARISPTPSDFFVKLQRKPPKKSTLLTDSYRRLLVIVKAKFFSDSAEQKIKASGEACVLVAQGTITCVVKVKKRKKRH
ncbi:hypothetical protein PRIPAC_81098 [Pristionchus pacificus]|uniref:Uncharacterized protein n=1 Tax=Pristionchus pacificus TaxID=54126 RepID=A0A2A6CNR0_PRIPA|nr:hypothetical protein PRIPAC_81098 [Pristionchus pacificus]|eukprot:PDM79750.1 hypothetical protein PRIPAC_32329 [Pristionchus pacificus]